MIGDLVCNSLTCLKSSYENARALTVTNLRGTVTRLTQPAETILAKKRSETIDFETALKELEGLVEKLEQGDLNLEASLAAFERGVQLTRTCQEALSQAEQKVEQLVNQSGQEQLAPFDSDET